MNETDVLHHAQGRLDLQNLFQTVLHTAVWPP